MPRARGLDRGQQVRLAKRLDEVAEDSGLDRARHELVLAVRREHHDRDRPLGDDPSRRLDAVELRHLHVHDREVGLEPKRERDRLLAVARLADDVHPRALQQLDEVEPDDRLVFGYEDPDAGRLPGAVHQHITSGTSRPALTAGSFAISARVSLDARRQHAEPAQRLVGLVAERPRQEQHPALVQFGEVREVLLLDLVQPLLRIVRRIRRPAKEDERVLLELHD